MTLPAQAGLASHIHFALICDLQGPGAATFRSKIGQTTLSRMCHDLVNLLLNCKFRRVAGVRNDHSVDPVQAKLCVIHSLTRTYYRVSNLTMQLSSGAEGLCEDVSPQMDDLDAFMVLSDDWDLGPLSSAQLQLLDVVDAAAPGHNSRVSSNSGHAGQHAQAGSLDTGQQQPRATKDQRRLAVGRETQRRFRIRQKVS